jgi:hypothetical protein
MHGKAGVSRRDWHRFRARGKFFGIWGWVSGFANGPRPDFRFMATPDLLRLNGILSVFHHGLNGFLGLHGKGIRVMGWDLPLISLSTLILEEGLGLT